MHAHRVNVFHVTDCNAVACAVPHHFVFNLFPAGDTALYQHLSHAGKAQTVFQNFLQFHLIVRDAAAGTAQCIGRAQYHRIADGIGKGDAVFYIFHYHGSRAGLSNALHQVLELLASLRVTDGRRRSAQQLYMMGCQKSGFFQLHTQI